MKAFKFICAMALVALFAGAGCRTVDSAERAKGLSGEGKVVFSRATDYTMFFGSRSPSDYFEVTYCEMTRNEADQPVVEVGLRYRGGTSWTNWMDTMPKHVELSAVCNFYRTGSAQAAGPAIYSTNRQMLHFTLGQTTAFRAVCPVKEAMGFQLVLGH